MTEKEISTYSKKLSKKIREVVINELKKEYLDDIGTNQEKIHILQAVILFDAPIRLASKIFDEPTSKSLIDMYKLIIKNTK